MRGSEHAQTKNECTTEDRIVQGFQTVGERTKEQECDQHAC